MRTNHSRQTRRATLCIRARSPRGHEAEISPNRAHAAADDDLLQVAARIADELELSADVIHELLWGPPRGVPRVDTPERGTIIQVHG